MAEDDLDAQLRRTDPDRWISSRFIAEADMRADVVAVYAFDGELARAPHASSNPIVCEMRLAWWREVLDEVFAARPVRRHPVAQALETAIRRRDLPREPLEALVDARYRELQPQPMTGQEARDWALGAGGRAAEIAAGLLDPAADASLARTAGGAWMLSRRASALPDTVEIAAELVRKARGEVRGLSSTAFPAVAHATLAAHPAASDLARRLRITWAVLRGRI